MFKKLVAPILGFLTITTFAAAAPSVKQNPFAGSYLGAGLGLSNQFYRLKIYNAGALELDEDMGTYGAAFQVMGGYNFALSRQWLLGIEANAEYDTNDQKVTINGTPSGSGRTKINWQLGASVKLGYTLKNNINMFYALLGPQWGHFRHTYDRNNVQINNVSQYQFGFKVGLGASQMLSHNIDISEEVDYSNLQGDKVTADSVETKFKPQIVTALVALHYHFH